MHKNTKRNNHVEDEEIPAEFLAINPSMIHQMAPDKLDIYWLIYKKDTIPLGNQRDGNWCPILSFLNFLSHEKPNWIIFAFSQTIGSTNCTTISRKALHGIFMFYAGCIGVGV
jgi:hypothetical protein